MSQLREQQKINFDASFQFMEKNYLKNRTIVSRDHVVFC